jgi:hypothetical protein
LNTSKNVWRVTLKNISLFTKKNIKSFLKQSKSYCKLVEKLRRKQLKWSFFLIILVSWMRGQRCISLYLVLFQFSMKIWLNKKWVNLKWRKQPSSIKGDLRRRGFLDGLECINWKNLKNKNFIMRKEFRKRLAKL